MSPLKFPYSIFDLLDEGGYLKPPRPDEVEPNPHMLTREQLELLHADCSATVH